MFCLGTYILIILLCKYIGPWFCHSVLHWWLRLNRLSDTTKYHTTATHTTQNTQSFHISIKSTSWFEVPSGKNYDYDLPVLGWSLRGFPQTLIPSNIWMEYGTEHSCLKVTKANFWGRPSFTGIVTFSSGPAYYYK